MTARDHLRAALLAIVLSGHAVYALPIPLPLRPADMKAEWRKEEMAQWKSWLSWVGIDWSEQEIGDRLIRSTVALDKAHRALKAPYRPLFGLTGTDQAWALFAGANTRPDRLVVEIDRGDGEWVPLLRRLDPCCTWRENVLRYRRLRGIWNHQPGRMRPAYRGLTVWIAREALTEHPEAARVRVYLEQSVSRYPWEPPDDRLAVLQQRVHGREVLAPAPAEGEDDP